MTARAGRPLLATLADTRFQSLLWVLAGAIGWAGVAVLGVALGSAGELGFDLELVLDAGRRVAAGQSPYDPALVAGTAQLEAVDLFYSYPPPLAQAFAPLAGMPSIVVLVGFAVLAVLAFALVGARIVGRFDPGGGPAVSLLPVLGVLPFLYPMSVALLFGNVDAWYPALYGLMLLAALRSAGPRERVAGGVALAVATVAKVHPASLGLWLVLRALRDRGLGLAVVSAVVVAAGAAAASVILGGVTPWTDYLGVVRTASAADLVLRNNIGPAAQLALLTGGGEGLARILQLPVTLVALALSALAAWRIRDPVVSLAVAAVASLVILPVSWFHYPVAVLPFALAARARSRGRPEGSRIAGLLVAAAVVAAVSIVLPVTVWIAVGLVLVAVRWSDPERSRTQRAAA